MKESEAWREIAERVDASVRLTFLCFAANDLAGEGKISQERAEVMKERVYAHIDASPSVHGSCIIETDQPGERVPVRVLAALFLALEAEEEGQ